MPRPVFPANAITGLPPLEWRGVRHDHYETLNYRWQHVQAQRAFPFLDVSGHQFVRRQSIETTVKMFFLNSLGDKDLFPNVWQFDWQPILLDGTPGKFLHPMLGEIDAVVKDVSVEINARSTAGCVVDVTWEETLIDPEAALLDFQVTVHMKDLAAAADAALKEQKINFPDGSPTSSLTELIGQIEGIVFLARTRVEGLMNQAIGLIDNLIDRTERIQEHVRWALLDHLKKLHREIFRLKDKAAALQRNTRELLFTFPTSLSEIASANNNKLREVLELNRSLLGKPTVPANTPIKVYA